jgi:hypothetical protein
MAMKKTFGDDSPLRQDIGNSGPSRSRVDDGGKSRCVSEKLIGSLGFSHQEEYIGGRAELGGGPGGLTTREHGPGVGRATLGCGWPVAPLRHLFGLLEALVNIRRFGFCFVQFQDYFLCNFFETQKYQKIGNWHCGISLIG